MSREDFEESEQAWLLSEFPKGAGDPDFYGYPGEEEITPPLQNTGWEQINL